MTSLEGTGESRACCDYCCGDVSDHERGCPREPFSWYGWWDEDDQFHPLGHEGAHIDGLCWCDKLPSAAEYAEKRKHEEAERAWLRLLDRSLP